MLQKSGSFLGPAGPKSVDGYDLVFGRLVTYPQANLNLVTCLFSAIYRGDNSFYNHSRGPPCISKGQ